MVSGSGSDLGQGVRIPWNDSLKNLGTRNKSSCTSVRNSQSREINKTYQNKICKFQD